MTDPNVDQWLSDYQNLYPIFSDAYGRREVKAPWYVDELLERADDE